MRTTEFFRGFDPPPVSNQFIHALGVSLTLGLFAVGGLVMLVAVSS